jgi:ABC-2 type transport system permease protein
MINAIRSEWIKLRTARSNLVLLVLAMVLPIALTLLLSLTISRTDAAPSDVVDITLAGTHLGGYLFGVLGVLVIGQEYRHTTIRVTFTAEPLRLRVMLAKVIAVASAGLVVGTISTLAPYGLGRAIFNSRDIHMSTPGGTQIRAIAGSVILFVLLGLCGLGLGAIIRATAGAITFLIVWPVVVEPILYGFVHAIRKWLPFNAGSRLVSTSRGDEGLSPWAGGAFFAGFVLLLVAVGTALVVRRDA